ncbi:hypothetical protein V8D89_014291 [Ganoderma adspersum]
MSSSSSQRNQDLKRKKPPTFQHLPAQRAKKLKQSWVEVQKIKSKWKAQKRKEGLVASRHQLQRRVGTDADELEDRELGGDPEDNEENERASGSSDGSLGGAASAKSGDEAVDSESEESSEGEGPGTSRTEETRRLGVEVGEAEIGAGEEEEVEVATLGVRTGFNEAVVVASRIWVFE